MVLALNNNKILFYKVAANLLIIPVLFLPLTTYSSNFTASLFYESEYSDNIDKAPSNAPKDFLSTIGTDIGFDHQSSLYQFQTNYNFSYLDYLYDSSDDEFQWSGDLFGSFEIIEDMLSWEIDHTQRYLVTNRREADSPTNRERISTLSTGPVLNLVLNPTGADALIFNNRYTKTSFGDTEQADSERQTFTVAWRHLVNRLTSFSLNAEYTAVTFDTGDNDYGQYRYSADVDRMLKQGNLTFGIGLNTVKPEKDDQANDQEDSSPFINAAVKNTWGRHSLNFSLGRKLTDNSSVQSEEDADSDFLESPQRDAFIQDIIDRQNATIAYGYAFDVDSLSLSLSWYDEDYRVEPADQTSVSSSAVYTMPISRRSVLTFSTSAERVDFKDDESVDKETTYDIGAGYTYVYPLTSELDLTLAANYKRRFSYGSPLPRYYEETSGALSLRYTLW